jgi:Na+/melibiose symporter-like transporter
MTHRMVFSEHLPTLALVALGASEAVVGLQRTLVYASVLLQLFTLRAVGRVSKRNILVTGQTVAVLGSLPLAFFAALEARSGGLGASIALAGFAVAAAGFSICETVWFPMLHGFVERHRIGRFFGTLRTGWHLTLILYFLGAQRWLAAHPGSFGPLFALGLGLGIVRIALIVRLPERSERTGAPIRARDAVALVRERPLLRRYLAGIVMSGAARIVFATFAIVMMRRVIGFSEAHVLYTTVAVYAGGLVSLYLWGRVVDAVGAEPVFRWTALGQAALMLGFLLVRGLDGAMVALATGIFFGIWVLASGFDVADTHVLFQMTPEETPARVLVPVRVVDSFLRGAAPLAVGIALGRALAAELDPLWVYRTLFIGAAAVQACAFLPLRVFK